MPLRSEAFEVTLSGFAGGEYLYVRNMYANPYTRSGPEMEGVLLVCDSNFDELVKSQKWDGKVKSSKCKACES